MSVYAAANICMAVENFKGRGYASLGGIILNRRNVEGEDEAVNVLANDFSSEVIGRIDRSEDVSLAEKEGKTVSEVCPGSAVCAQLDALADEILKGFGGVS